MATLMIFSDRTEIYLDSKSRDKHELSVKVCSTSQVYDPYIDQCRDLTCPGGFSENGVNCVQVQTSAVADVEIKLTVTGSLQKLVGLSDTDWETVVHQSVDDFLSIVLLATKEGNGLTRNSAKIFCNDLKVTWVCSSVEPRATPWLTCEQHNPSQCSVNISLDCDASPTHQLINFNHVVQDVCFKKGGLWNSYYHLDAFTVTPNCSLQSDESRNQTNSSEHRSTKFLAKAMIWDATLGAFKSTNLTKHCDELNPDCPLLTFSKTDYVFTGAFNESIKLIGYNNTIFLNGQYKISDNGSLQVCSFLARTAPSSGDLDELLQLILTVAGSSVSMVGLTVTIATYVAFPALRRNVADKSLMSLVAALFFAQATMLIGFNMNDIQELCSGFAIASHFFWLSAFFWMNLLAIEIYRTFGVGTRLKHVSTYNRSVLCHALYGWGSPSVIVCVCVILSYCNCVDVDVHYGDSEVCWLGGGTANLVAFGVPVALIIGTNAVLFALTIIGIRITMRASGKMNVTQGQKRSVKRANTDLFLYLKLSAIMGFTWIFGFIASLFNLPAFWYPYIILNSLQGALVCLAFVCNRRVIAMWKTKLGMHLLRHARNEHPSSPKAQKKPNREAVTLSEKIAEESSNSINMTKM
ncbi:adhesion G-protein coupled receptor G6-like [Asterias rubens]|uniref:adhesion G-protein coupled receptor G6-like n=1 Tax=Asterias rubens TaxID=7604 RepID=UPI001455B3AF|nr:adhesion G-protein coupled receptor G6-like [Asterias rubens]